MKSTNKSLSTLRDEEEGREDSLGVEAAVHEFVLRLCSLEFADEQRQTKGKSQSTDVADY